MHLIARKDDERRLFLNAIGPIWDGNEVWLVVFGGAIFAAFPRAYAAAFSGFYTPFMLILFALIFRAVSIEVRSKQPMTWWRSTWDVAFCIASFLATFLFGVAVGNSIAGLPLGPDGDFLEAVPLLTLLRPYPSLVGLFAVATFAMHGSIYLYLKTEGDLQKRIHAWMWRTFAVFLTLYVVVTIFTLSSFPNSTAKYAEHPWALIVVILNLLAIANIPRAIYLGRPFYAFISSSCTIAAFTFLFGLTLYPNLIVSSVTAEWSMTVSSAASSDTTLEIMTLIALLGMPFVLSYTITINWLFRGKVKMTEFSY
jgi:cytochrome d ubiquinol oxidase subunit II